MKSSGTKARWATPDGNWRGKALIRSRLSNSIPLDGETCWVPWYKWKECSARDCNEWIAPCLSLYPTQYGSGYRQTVDFPKPPATCSQMQRPSNIGYQFQPRLTVHGYCRIRGIFLHAVKVEKRLYDRLCPG